MSTANPAPQGVDEEDPDLEGEGGVETPDDEELSAPKQALLYTFPVSQGSQQSKCGVCSRLNPSIDGTVIRKQMVRLADKDGKGVGKYVKGEVRVRAIAYSCGPDRNPECPAREVRMVIGVNTDQLARRIHRAEQQDDHTLMAELYAKLATIDEDLRKTVMATVKTLRISEGASNDGSNG